MKNLIKYFFVIIFIFLMGVITVNIKSNIVMAEASQNVSVVRDTGLPRYIKLYNRNDFYLGSTGYTWNPKDGEFGILFDLEGDYRWNMSYSKEDIKKLTTLDGYRFTGWGPAGLAWGQSEFGASDGGCTAGRMSPFKFYQSMTLTPCFVPNTMAENLTKVTVGYYDAPPSVTNTNLKWAIQYYGTCTYDNTKTSSCTLETFTPKYENYSTAGYIFNGWSEEANCIYGEMSPQVSYDVMLHSCWLPNDLSDSILVYYDANGGYGGPIKQGYRGKTAYISTKIPVRDGYTFLGYNTNKNATTASYYPGDMLLANADNASITLYAIWKNNGAEVPVQTYTISYNANGGIGEPTSQVKTQNVNLTLSNVKPVREGYTFIGWNTNKNATTSQYNPGSVYSSNASITLYAIWKKNEVPVTKYTVSYDANGGTNVPSSQVKTKDVNLTLSIIKPIKEGYEFIGWNTNKNATTLQYNPGSVYEGNASITLYAIWKKNEVPVTTYTVSYDANGGINPPSSQFKVKDVSLNLSNVKPTREGYEFIGWSTNKKATTAQYSAGGVYVNNAQTTLYAVWKKNEVPVTTYTVSYDANGGVGEPSNQVKKKDTKLTLSSIKPTREGYEFLGWNTDKNAQTHQYSVGSVYNKNKSVTLYAVWKKNEVPVIKYTVSYDANGGIDVPKNQDEVKDKNITLSNEKPTREGYEFLGWSTDKTSTEAQYNAGSVYEGNSSTTLYAIWKANEYTINYKTNGGIINNITCTATYDETIQINIPVKNVTIKGVENATGASISDDVSVMLEFEGWTSDNLNEKTAYYSNELWKNGKTKVKDTTFKNLISSSKTVNLEANWKNEEVILPVVEKENYSCFWNTKQDGSGTNYDSGTKYVILGNEIYEQTEYSLNDNTCGDMEYNNIINLYAICEELDIDNEQINSKNKSGSIIIYIIIGIFLLIGGYVAYRVIMNRKSV